ncbi:MAG TPA: hypothetical protein VMT64_07115 [Candidatus Binataceae bacterium]|nr:hypothetical protein [Candidatus Binataceae bacterium]
MRQQIEKWAKKYPAEYKPKNEKGNNQGGESSPVRWNVHSLFVPVSFVFVLSVFAQPMSQIRPPPSRPQGFMRRIEILSRSHQRRRLEPQAGRERG